MMQVTDQAQLRLVSEWLERAPVIVLDLETSGLDPLSDRIIVVGLSDGHRTVLIDARRFETENLRQTLAPLLARAPLVVMHHARFDLRFLLSLGIQVENPVDTLINQKLLDNGRRVGRHSLGELSQRLLGVRLDKEQQRSFTSVGDGALSGAQLEYARRDLLATYQIFMRQVGGLAREDLGEVAAIEANALNAFAAMEHRGLPIDVDAWRKLSDGAQRQRAAARERLDALFREVADLDLFRGVDIHYDSEPELREHLARLGIEVESTARHIMAGLDHPVGQAIMDYREAAKIVSTYGEGFLAHVHPRTGRIHAQFKQIGASTGRVSCTDPNLQNIPKSSSFRSCIRACEGRVLITADYGACELRILAQASRDPAFVEAFRLGQDLHARVASEMFAVPVSKTQRPELRHRAKAINFGLVYGMGAAGLSTAVGCSHEEAEKLLDTYFERYPAVRRYLDQTVRISLGRGYASTLTGRRLWFRRDELDGPDAVGRLGRIAKNMPIQGTSADITKLAMGRMHRDFTRRGLDAAIVNCVHDEIVVECAANLDLAGDVRAIMEQAEAEILTDIPPAVDLVVDRAWAKD